MKINRIQFALGAAFLLCFLNSSFAQKGDAKGVSVTYVNPNAKVAKYNTKEELEKMNKTELTKLYMERIAIITELAPYIALHTKPGATLDEMGIPKNPQNLEHLNKEVKNKEAYLKSVSDTLDDIVPYADKGNIIWSILFLEEMIQKIESQSQH